MLILFLYIFETTEANSKNIKDILNTPYQGLELFHDSSLLLQRIVDITIGSKSVATINLSDMPETFQSLQNYFSDIHRYISNGNNLLSFRRIAGLQNKKKAIWLMEASANLIETSRLSVAFTDARSEHIIDLCFHVVERDEGWYTFIFPSVDLTGKMPAILIKNDLVAHAMTDYFNSLWRKLPHLHDGKKLNSDSFKLLEKWFPDIIEEQKYKPLKEKLKGETV